MSTDGRPVPVRPDSWPLPSVAAESVSVPSPAKRDLPKGIAAPVISGDIKVTVNCSAPPSVTIRFQDFPLSRRNRPLSRSEARKVSDLSPLVMSQGDAHSFVVVQAKPGIYTISASQKDAPVSATFHLKLFEGGAREISRKIGTLKVAEKTDVVKILMPDGIVWDDDAAFSGSLEDSDSITKFNTETGLSWKEYK